MAAKTKKEPAIALKDVMSAIDKKDRGFYSRLTDEQKKAFSAWMMMRYASSVQGRNAAHYLFMVNELVNKNFSDVSRHPELQWLLLSAAGSGKVEFHPYIKPPNSKKKKDKVAEFLSSVYPHFKGDEIDMLISINSKEELKQLAESHGYDDKSIKDIFGK
jgi:hypothetical protein